MIIKIVEQKLQGHNNGIWNVIEIKENELISVSYITLWKNGN